jgi:uncharacterized protein
VKALRISPDLSLPIDFVTQTQAILAKRGVGKSYLASVEAEELLKNGQQVVVIDPTGAWWGLRSSADGTGAGFPIVVIGGERGDIPLEEAAGELVATAIVERRFSAVIDLSLFRKGQVRRFLTPFLETLYRLNREPLHLIVDEADDVCPQKPFGDEAQMVGAMEDVVKRGRKKGIGCTLITQRPADLAKQVLTQCEVLVALRLVHPRDIAAIKEWVNVHADPAQAEQMIASLPSLPVGTAWFWSPGWGDIFQRVKVRQRETFDSGATPKAGEKVRSPKVLAEVDINQLGEAIKKTVEDRKANDPAALKKRIKELEAAAAKATPAKVETKTVEVPVLTNEHFADLARLARKAQEAAEVVDGYATAARDAAQGIIMALERLRKPAATTRPLTPRPEQKKTAPRPIRASSPPADADGTLPKGERAILTACAQYDGGRDRAQLTVLTGYKRSSRDTYVQRLREKGYVDIVGDQVQATANGVHALGEFEALPTGDELRAWWMSRLPQGERIILEFLCDAHPAAVDRDALTNASGYQRSSRDTYIQRLAAKKLVVAVGRGEVKAADELFD